MGTTKTRPTELARRGVFVGKGEETPAAPATVAAIAEKWYALVDSDPGTLRPSTAYDYKSRIRANVVPALGPLAAHAARIPPFCPGGRIAAHRYHRDRIDR